MPSTPSGRFPREPHPVSLTASGDPRSELLWQLRTLVFHTGVHRLCTTGAVASGANGLPGVCPAFPLVSAPFVGIHGRFGGRETEGSAHAP